MFIKYYSYKMIWISVAIDTIVINRWSCPLYIFAVSVEHSYVCLHIVHDNNDQYVQEKT